MKKVVNVIGALVIAGALFFLLGRGGPTVSGERAKAMVKEGALLLDVSPSEDFAVAHVESAVNIPVEELEARLPAEKDRTVVVYCRTGQRSAVAKKVLLAAGFPRVFDLGAMSNWK